MIIPHNLIHLLFFLAPNSNNNTTHGALLQQQPHPHQTRTI